MRAAARGVLALALTAACSRGAPDNTAGDVADRFVDMYIVEIDQARALPLTTGTAARRIQEELDQTAGVRSTGYSAELAKPTVYYERTSLKEEAGGARAVYDIRIKHATGEERRHVLVSLHNREGGAWKVAGFFLQDGPAR